MFELKDVVGFEGLYKVSNTGEIHSLGNFPRLRNKVTGILKGGDCKGYRVVILTGSDGKRHNKIIHRLVAEHYLPNPDNLRCVNHKDEDKSNNCVDNLEWCTDQYNKEYSNKKTFTLKSPDNRLITTKNVSRFCRENGLQQGNMCKVIAGIRTHHRGWSLP